MTYSESTGKAAEPHDPLRRDMQTASCPRGAVDQTFRAFLLEALKPLVGGSDTDINCIRSFFRAQPLDKDAIHEQDST